MEKIGHHERANHVTGGLSLCAWWYKSTSRQGGWAGDWGQSCYQWFTQLCRYVQMLWQFILIFGVSRFTITEHSRLLGSGKTTWMREVPLHGLGSRTADFHHWCLVLFASQFYLKMWALSYCSSTMSAHLPPCSSAWWLWNHKPPIHSFFYMLPWSQCPITA